MKRIASFEVDHTVLEKGMYISRVDGDVVTYDIRTRKPNVEEVMDNASIHTVEHLFATFVRNSQFTDRIIYFGPMGCRTGFYLLLRDCVSKEEVIKLTQDAFEFIAGFGGEIPGNSRIECGNYLEHDLSSAKEIAADMAAVLENWTEEKLIY